jgi:hypothetical protein
MRFEANWSVVAGETERTLPRALVPFARETTQPADLQELSRADDGIRTHDLLHGKQML